MSEFLTDIDLHKVDGTTVKGGEVLKGKVVLLYFSAHWCPPCRAFTPILKDFYEELEGLDLEILFVSFDRSLENLKEYMKESHGDWYYVSLEFGKDVLSKKYGVEGIPALIAIKSNGDVITKTARNDVSEKTPVQALSVWKSQM